MLVAEDNVVADLGVSSVQSQGSTTKLACCFTQQKMSIVILWAIIIVVQCVHKVLDGGDSLHLLNNCCTLNKVCSSDVEIEQPFTIKFSMLQF